MSQAASRAIIDALENGLMTGATIAVPCPSFSEIADYAHATPEEAEVEARAQICRALDPGMDVTHLDSHITTLQYDRRGVLVLVLLAKESGLTLRMASQAHLEANNPGDLRQLVGF